MGNFKEVFKNEYNGIFATNSKCERNSLLWKSLPTWLDLVDENLMLIPGEMQGRPFYGLNAFMYMLYKAMQMKVDYIIYFDEDAFLLPNSEDEIEKLFKDFVDSGCIVAGLQDGGSFCHRNHNTYLVNTFFSFWNVKEMIQSGIYRKVSFETDLNTYFSHLGKTPFYRFMNSIPKDLLNNMETASSNARSNAKKRNTELTKKYFDGKEFPYATIVRNDPKNPVEPHQVPYSYKLDDFEPYYVLLEYLVDRFKKPIYYIPCSDFPDMIADPEIDSKYDTPVSGITSAVYSSNESKNPIILHTWFSRAYIKGSGIHYERIRAIDNYVKNLNNKDIFE